MSVTGHEIVLRGASLDASGDTAGGTVLVGGDWQGRNAAVPNAQNTQVNFSTTLKADARETGDGGKVVVWSDQDTQFFGTVSARGGAQSGDGGRIEVSGKENLVFGGIADAGAPNGKAGTLLLDPKNIIIERGRKRTGRDATSSIPTSARTTTSAVAPSCSRTATSSRAIRTTISSRPTPARSTSSTARRAR